MWRILTIFNGLLFVPTIALGFMIGMSGGGLPPYPQIGNALLLVAVGIPLAMMAAWVFHRLSWGVAAIIVGLLPIVAVVALSIALQVQTRWFG